MNRNGVGFGGRRALRRLLAAVGATVAAVSLSSASVAGSPHAEFDALSAKYVTGDGVRYDAWAKAPEDVRRLSAYIDSLERTAVGSLERDQKLAFWINLYNAATLELVLSHYPVDSIKDIGGFLRSPWKKKVVTVEGKALSLDAIENDILRPQFEDARIHFAINCASVGCPLLANEAYEGARLDEQLDAACRRALNDPRWVRVEGKNLVLTRIFDWYRDDFVRDAGSLPAFIARYRAEGAELPAGENSPRIRYADYDWSLNRAR